ncbi:hypothetical protein RHMOL_Rhmol02G0032300 [Rhododendron molle]|uniref:Uncharacterized protein n=1 Tax=Rhododendron molle TaxID=49168 RepID=A0ACC0PKT6_RHOML|nr:hypothetical protein RHMOL_Rhmol02G0032300 [Rhododendron molle]
MPRAPASNPRFVNFSRLGEKDKKCTTLVVLREVTITQLIGCLNTTDASASKERREPSGWVYVSRWLEGVGRILRQSPTGNGKVAKPVPA